MKTNFIWLKLPENKEILQNNATVQFFRTVRCDYVSQEENVMTCKGANSPLLPKLFLE